VRLVGGRRVSGAFGHPGGVSLRGVGSVAGRVGGGRESGGKRALNERPYGDVGSKTINLKHFPQENT